MSPTVIDERKYARRPKLYGHCLRGLVIFVVIPTRLWLTLGECRVRETRDTRMLGRVMLSAAMDHGPLSTDV